MILKKVQKIQFGQCLKIEKKCFVIIFIYDTLYAGFKTERRKDIMYLGPRDKNTEVTDVEELQIIEAFAEAEEYLETGIVDDYFFDTED